MPQFGQTSRSRLDTCHPDLVKVMNHAIKRYDFSIAFGVRTDEVQMGLFMKGREKTDNGYKIVGPTVTNCDGIDKRSRHQEVDGFSNAVDIVPYINGSMDWNNKKEWKILSRTVWNSIQELQVTGQVMSIIRWGGFWTSLIDYPHWEIINGR